MITIKLTKGELFELIEATDLKVKPGADKDLINAYNKLKAKQPTIDYTKVNLNYEIPDFKPRKKPHNAD